MLHSFLDPTYSLLAAAIDLLVVVIVALLVRNRWGRRKPSIQFQLMAQMIVLSPFSVVLLAHDHFMFMGLQYNQLETAYRCGDRCGDRRCRHSESRAFYLVVRCVYELLVNSKTINEGVEVEIPKVTNRDVALLKWAFERRGWQVTVKRHDGITVVILTEATADNQS
jgi:hypothetical protein